MSSSTFTQGVYAKSTNDRIGWGVTLNPDGSKNTITGPELIVYPDEPEGHVSANMASIVLVNSVIGGIGAAWWGKSTGSGNTGWTQFATSKSGGWFLDDVKCYFGTLKETWIEYDSGTSELAIVTMPVSSLLGTESTYGIHISTGTVTVVAAVTGPDSAYVSISSGATNANHAGATGGNTGAISIVTGGAIATIGTPGDSGSLLLGTGTGANTSDILVVTGNASAGDSGDLLLNTGTATGTRGWIQAQTKLEVKAAICMTGTQTSTNPASGSTVSVSATASLVVVNLGAPIANLTFDFGAASANNDGRVVQVVTNNNITGAITLTSTGATFSRAVAKLDTGAAYDVITNPFYTFKYQYNHASTTWLRVG
jgi:hypothetical protein